MMRSEGKPMRIPLQTLDDSVAGVGLKPGTFRDQLWEGVTLVVFLRFFGCIFCRETIADLRKLVEEREDFPRVLFVAEAGTVETRAFLRRYWPAARSVSDPHGVLYDAFGVGRGFLKTFGIGVFVARRRATAKGHEGGEVDGDVLRMPGVFLMRGEEVVWSHRFRHMADHPDFADLPTV
jgi:hypothetical protein